MKSNLYNPTMPNVFLSNAVAWGGGRSEADFTREAEEKAAADAKAGAEAKAAQEKAAEAAKVKAAADAAQVDKDAQAARVSQNSANMMEAATNDPSSLVTKADVAPIDPNAAGTNIGTGTGQVKAPTAVTEPTAFDASKVDPTKVSGEVETAVAGLDATQGVVSTDATVQAAQGSATDLSQLGLEAAQIDQAQVVTPAAARSIQTGELVSGSAVDMAAVDEALDVQAAQADPTIKATVQGQMADLMQDFDGTEPPAWAAGALRNATAQMAARGLGASSVAGQALIQAAMESALPIAAADAKTQATFELQNLSNRQQTAMFAAEQRANFLGMEFTQEFQTRVANAAKISDVANMNFTAEQQVALENARMAQSVDLANLNAANAKVLSDAAAMSNMDMANLNNRQQAAVQNAQSFLAMDMKNMDLQQQTNLFKTQSIIQGIFSDQSADNAAKQFNAASENQVNQFFANMSSQVQQFNAGMELQTDQFNAKNALVIAQANAQWRQNASTINAGAQNQANLQAAQSANNISQTTLDQVWQRERDIMNYSFTQSEAAEDRALSVFLADKQAEVDQRMADQKASAEANKAKGYILTRLLFGK